MSMMMMTTRPSQTKAKALILSTFYGTYLTQTHQSLCMHVCVCMHCNARQSVFHSCSAYFLFICRMPDICFLSQNYFIMPRACSQKHKNYEQYLQTNIHTHTDIQTHTHTNLSQGKIIRTTYFLHSSLSPHSKCLFSLLPVLLFQDCVFFTKKIIAIYIV